MYHRIGRYFVGLGGQHGIQKRLDTFPEKQKRKPLFSNRPQLRSISSRRVMGRNQVDFVDLRKLATTKGEITYTYVLSLVDVFSRYVILQPLSDKSAKVVAQHLSSVYSIFGPPRLLQCDQGKEFTARVTRQVMKAFNCRMIYGSPYHPQSQGKVSKEYCSAPHKTYSLYFDLIHLRFYVTYACS